VVEERGGRGGQLAAIRRRMGEWGGIGPSASTCPMAANAGAWRVTRGRDGPGRGVGWDGLWQPIGALLRWQFVCGSASLLSLMTGYDLRRPDHLDLYAATRASADDPWSAPVNLGAVVNTANNETRPSLSWDAKALYFGRAGSRGIDRHLRDHAQQAHRARLTEFHQRRQTPSPPALAGQPTPATRRVKARLPSKMTWRS